MCSRRLLAERFLGPLDSFEGDEGAIRDIQLELEGLEVSNQEPPVD